MTARDEEQDQEHRPGAVLYVYTWDLVLVILALLVTLAPFAGAVQSSAGVQPLPFYAQVIEAVSSAAFAATLIILAALLTRRHAWVRIVQIGTLVTHIALAIISEVVLAISGNSAGVPGLLGTLLFILLDGLAILIMTDRRVRHLVRPARGDPGLRMGGARALGRRQRPQHRAGRRLPLAMD